MCARERDRIPTYESSVSPPAQRKRSYRDSLESFGSFPESLHWTVIMSPPLAVEPATGVMNSTSARAAEASANKRDRGWINLILSTTLNPKDTVQTSDSTHETDEESADCWLPVLSWTPSPSPRGRVFGVVDEVSHALRNGH